MSDLRNIYDAGADLSPPCSCDRHGSQHEHNAATPVTTVTTVDHETLGSEVVESAMVRRAIPG